LERSWPAFYLGSVAADVQTITDIPREKTHFYGLPPGPGEGYQRMLADFPELGHPDELTPAHAVFIAAYCAHLLLDVRWFEEVLTPFFIGGDWGDHRHRFIVHNTLLTYLDRQARAALPDDAGAILAAAHPDRWLPFAEDTDLLRWRDLLVEQLQPGAASQTVAIYAQRLRMTPAHFEANLDDPAWMDEQLFRNVPLASVTALLDSAVAQTGELVSDYLTQIIA
jgi:hypothetical protein